MSYSYSQAHVTWCTITFLTSSPFTFPLTPPILLLLQADQILIFFFCSHFSNHSEGPDSFTQGMGNERVGEAEDGGREARRCGPSSSCRPGGGEGAPTRRMETAERAFSPSGPSQCIPARHPCSDSRDAPGPLANVVQRQGGDAQACGGRTQRGVATAGAWRNLARGSGFRTPLAVEEGVSASF